MEGWRRGGDREGVGKRGWDERREERWQEVG